VLRSILTSADPALALRLATTWQAGGDVVTVVLLDAAAATARPGHSGGDTLRAAVAGGVRIAAESDALARRGLEATGLADGVSVIDLDEVADLLTARGSQAVWL